MPLLWSVDSWWHGAGGQACRVTARPSGNGRETTSGRSRTELPGGRCPSLRQPRHRRNPARLHRRVHTQPGESRESALSPFTRRRGRLNFHSLHRST